MKWLHYKHLVKLYARVGSDNFRWLDVRDFLSTAMLRSLIANKYVELVCRPKCENRPEHYSVWRISEVGIKAMIANGERYTDKIANGGL